MAKALVFAVAASMSIVTSSACMAAETPIHVFAKASGTNPESPLLPDGRGGFYGTANSGGMIGHGTVFHLAPPDGTHPAWTLTPLHSFAQTEGRAPQDIALGNDGALYGANAAGGLSDDGTLFRLAPPVAGSSDWTQTVLCSFDDTHGASPLGLLGDPQTTMSGAAMVGGADCGAGQDGCGTTVQISAPTSPVAPGHSSRFTPS